MIVGSGRHVHHHGPCAWRRIGVNGYQVYRHYAWLSGIGLTCVLAFLKLGFLPVPIAALLGIPLLLGLVFFAVLATRAFRKAAASPAPVPGSDDDDEEDGSSRKSLKKMRKLRLKAEKKSWKRREKERRGEDLPDDD